MTDCLLLSGCRVSTSKNCRKRDKISMRIDHSYFIVQACWFILNAWCWGWMQRDCVWIFPICLIMFRFFWSFPFPLGFKPYRRMLRRCAVAVIPSFPGLVHRPLCYHAMKPVLKKSYYRVRHSMYEILIADELRQCFVIKTLPVHHIPSHFLLHCLTVIISHSLRILMHNFVIFQVFPTMCQYFECRNFLVSTFAQRV
jgi:hypothetical protein